VTTPWLHVIGIGEEGVSGLSPAARSLVQEAEVIFGGDRHQALAGAARARRMAWPSPFDAMIGAIRAEKGKRVVVLVTGDPLWYSVGARITRDIPAEEICFHPQLSAFQLAAARLGWSLADSETLSLHGRPSETVIPFIRPGARLIVLSTGAATPREVAVHLERRGYGASRIVVFAAMGGPAEARFEGTAQDWSTDVPDFNTLAVECFAGPGALIAGQGPGLDDDLFRHDGNITKSEIRAVALSRLVPMRGAVLWDIGCGSGSVSIEWMRAARDALAYGIEPRQDRRDLARENAQSLGVPKLELIAGEAPSALAGLPAPDAVFIGGGLSRATFVAAWTALKPFGRLVANAVSLQSENLLGELALAHGGSLVRISVERAGPLGDGTGWHPLRAVTQLALVKR
jgi:precorrin-6Y C5,15-methyltransferase (decarboxylating)